jgi:hypothetical protein
MHRRHQSVGFGGDDGEAAGDGAALALMAGPDTGERERLPVRPRDGVGLLALVIQALPLEERRRRDEAAALGEGRLEQR